MFWKTKNNNNKKTTDKRTKPAEGLQASGQGNSEGRSKGQSSASEAIRAQALANAQAARERLGEETIQKIAEAIRRKQSSPVEQAKMKIENSDADLVVQEILNMLDE